MVTLKSLSNLELIKLAKRDTEDFKIYEKDFYQPEDNRMIRSGVSNIYGGDNFGDFTEEFFEAYESDLFD